MNEQDIPIDIHCNKLQEWLTSRRIIVKNIQPYIKDVRNRIQNAIQDMPANEDLIKLLSGSHINYFHCKQIIEILKQTEKDTKSVFGTYGSQRMKDWQEIVKIYERENVYIGEAAQIFVRNLTYEIPGIKKQMTRFEQQSDEALKRIQDLNKTEHILMNEHNALCNQLCIKGDNLKQELTDRLKELPKLYVDSIKDISNLNDSIELYSEFSKNSNCLPILKHVIEFGNSTIYQYINKEVPLTIEENPIILNIVEENEVSEGGIDFGDIDFGTNDSSPEVIDFGEFTSEDLPNTEVDIDWGEQMEAGSPSKAVEIDFDLPLEEYGIIVEGVGVEGGIAKGEQALTILDSPNYREKFLNELYELESFLKLRNYELSQADSAAIFCNLSTHDAKSINRMLKFVDNTLVKLLSEQTQHLFQLKHSVKYADLLVGKLKQKLVAIDKIKLNKEILKTKSADLLQEKEALKPILQEMINKTKSLQQQIETDISRRYKNRTVNLMGGVNTI